MTSTPYQPMGFKGGYENTQLDKNVFEVTFSGNGLTSRQRVRDFAMLRSAELTIQNGYKYFISTNENTSSTQHTVVTPQTSPHRMQPHGLLGLREHQKLSGECFTKNNPLKQTPSSPVSNPH